MLHTFIKFKQMYFSYEELDEQSGSHTPCQVHLRGSQGRSCHDPSKSHGIRNKDR